MNDIQTKIAKSRRYINKELLLCIVLILILTDLAILLNIPFLRQIFGFFFLTFLPGLLILQILKLNRIDSTEKLILAVGLSISFLMLFGILINLISMSFGYESPLSTVSLLIWFNLAATTLILVVYWTNENVAISLPNFNLSTSEKAFLIVPILFPALSIFGMRVMNTTDNNIILMFMLFLIPIYIALVCFFNHKFPKRLYPVVIFLIGISLLLLQALRSSHLLGRDVHQEYYLFQIVLDNLHWQGAIMRNALDACLSISLLPCLYQSILNVNPEFLFKILYPLLYSISPLIIYCLVKKYVGELYAFLASCLFMFQFSFLGTTGHARTNIAILFLALMMMVLFNDKIDPLKKRLLIIIFMMSCIVSHYSTAYILFFIILGTFVGVEILSLKYTFKKVVSFTIVVIFFAMIFFWYSQVTVTSFYAGVGFIEATLNNLNNMFVDELRSEGMREMLGKGIQEKSIPSKIEFIFTWLIFAYIAIGVITLIIKYKEMSFPELKFKRPDFLREKFEVTYFLMALICSGLLFSMVLNPYISTHYGIERLFSTAITILCVFFVIGGILLSKLILKIGLIKNLSFKKKALPKKQKEKRNTLEARAYLIILVVLIPYFFCVTGVLYQMFDCREDFTLNSEGGMYNSQYIHDQESYNAKWLKSHADEKAKMYTDRFGDMRLQSQGGIRSNSVKTLSKDYKGVIGYIYLRYYNVVDGKFVEGPLHTYNMTDYSDIFSEMCKIYASGGSEVWKK